MPLCGCIVVKKKKYSNLLTDYQQTTATMLGDIYNLDQCFDIRLGKTNWLRLKQKASPAAYELADGLQSLHALQNGLNELKTMANETVKEVIADYESMTKSDYKALQAQIKRINGFTLGTVATVKKCLITARRSGG